MLTRWNVGAVQRQQPLVQTQVAQGGMKGKRLRNACGSGASAFTGSAEHSNKVAQCEGLTAVMISCG